ncbi:ninein isoform X5 [Narcine bancroftii]|uniref:ninein isoform X5 n=1 Tax=Narcine bancroftii TaxID=1343680 RepID=UPI0038312009
MDEAEQDKYEARLKEVFDSFDTIGSGSLGREELTDLCHMLQLQEVAPVLLQTLLEENLSGRVHFEQFKEALILILSTTIEGNFSGDDSYQELESTEVQPKYVKDGKRYGRRTAPESQDSLEEVTGSLPKSDGRQPEHTPSRDDIENWKTSTEGEEYEAEGQLGFWNPDDLNTSQNVFGADPKWIEERLQAIAEELGVTKDSYLSSKELTSICDQCGLLNVDAEILDDIFQKLDQDGLMRLEDFLQGIFKKSAPPSASTPYRQLKRHHSLQPFDGSGRRTASPSAMTSTIGLHLFSCLDDGTGYTSADQILDAWQNEGIANGLEILKSLDFALYGKVNLSEFTLALENELLITKNGIHQAVLASFKNEIRYLMERADQISREKEKLRTDLEKAEKLKNLMASEVDDRHAAIEQLNECNLRKLEQEYKNRLAALKTDLTKEKDQFFLQANKQRIELEKEIEKERAEEGYLRDRLALALKENSRLEKELLENSEKLFESEILAKKLKHNLDTVLKEKFGGLDPTSAEFFLNEEKFKWLRNEYEQQFRELQDRIDELQSELQAYQTRGNGFKQLVASSLSEEMERKNDMGDCDPDFGLEECNLPNMSLEAEMAIEQIKEQHHQTIHSLKAEFEAKVNYYEEQMEETRVKYEMEKEGANQVHNNEIAKMKEEMKELENHVSHLQRETETIKNLQHSTEWKHREEKNELEYRFNIDKAQLEEQLRQEHETIQSKMEETSHTLCKEREELLERLNVTEVQMEVQRKELREAFRQEKMELEQAYSRQISELTENLQHEKEELQRNLLYNNQNELLQESSESKELADESDILKDQKTTLKEEGDYHLKILEMNGAQQELIQQVEILKGDKMSAHKIIDVLNKEVVELTSWNQQLDIENEDLCQKNSKNQADVLELKQRLAELIRQKEKRAGNLQKWEEEKNNLMQEIENSHFSKCSKLEDEVTALRHTNEKLIREKETLSNEVSRCIEKIAKMNIVETHSENLRQEWQSSRQEVQKLSARLNTSQEQLQNLEESLQSSNFQTAKLKSDFRVAQQEKEALKKEVMLLHKQLQATKDKIQVLEHTWDSADFQQQQKFYQDDLTRLMEEEQRLLREENERLQKEGELHIAREKVKQLESAILTLKHQKHYTKSTMLKAAEQEKLCMKREYDQIQKDLTRKLSLMISLEHEVKVLNVENEMLRKKQASLECQLMEMNEKLLQSNSNLTFSQTQNLRELQQMQEQICSMVPKEQLIHLQERLNLEEVQSRQLQEQLDVKTAETKMQQEAYEQLLKKMEERMQDVENKLRNIKLLLQDKVIQLKEQLSKNIKADEIVKDLYIENAQLLKALEMSEQRQKTTEKKNYLLEENIAGLNKILKDLSASSLSSASTCYSS